MSYDIDTWKTKRLENLQIPLSAFYKHERTDWHPSKPTVIDPLTMAVKIECACEQSITGILKDGILTVTEFDMTGEGSGTFWEWILKPALEESTGILEAVRVWEGGDYIDRLAVSNGKIKEKKIDL